MRRGRGRPIVTGTLLTLVALGGLAGCGGPEEGPRFVIEMQSQALLEDAALLAIYFYGEGRTCEELRATLPRPTSVLGPFRADLDDAGREAGIVFRQDAVPVGTYVVFIDALDANGALVGNGCTPGQRVLEREVASIKVLIREP